ncbi:MAG: hypothetical protein ACOC8H_02045 [bacterium]
MLSLYYITVMTVSRASEILRRCEAELKSVLSEDAAAGDYASVLQVTKWARGISDMLQQRDGSQRTVSHGKAAAEERTGTPGLQKGFHNDRAESSDSGQRNPRKRSRRKGGLQKSGYPKFGKRGDDLIKVGWSKKHKKEYHHKAPKHVAELLASALLDALENKEVVTTDDIFPLADNGGAEVPNYQSYICLAWFKKSGLVTQEGRQGYRIADHKSLEHELNQKWRQLRDI